MILLKETDNKTYKITYIISVSICSRSNDFLTGLDMQFITKHSLLFYVIRLSADIISI